MLTRANLRVGMKLIDRNDVIYTVIGIGKNIALSSQQDGETWYSTLYNINLYIEYKEPVYRYKRIGSLCSRSWLPELGLDSFISGHYLGYLRGELVGGKIVNIEWFPETNDAKASLEN